MRNMRATLALSAAMTFVLAGCAGPDAEDDIQVEDEGALEAAEELAYTDGFMDWDLDRSEFIDRNEFDARWGQRGMALDWDADRSGDLTRDEYGQGLFAHWDRNGDDRLDKSEWRGGMDRFWRDDTYEPTWADWDLDGDSELDLNEVREGFERDGLYDRVDGDRDALIDDEELADWFFDVFDDDDDGRIDTTEWESTWIEG